MTGLPEIKNGEMFKTSLRGPAPVLHAHDFRRGLLPMHHPHQRLIALSLFSENSAWRITAQRENSPVADHVN